MREGHFIGSSEPVELKLSFSVLLVWAVMILGVLFWMISLTDGLFIYAIDDPYIHLAVAENILRGGYGVNIQEYSSPSSSVIYPFLLSVSLWLGGGVYGPLIFNLIFMGTAIWLALQFLFRKILGDATDHWVFALACAAILLLAMSAIALPFVGMEHSLHVLLIVVVVRELVRFHETGRAGLLLVAAAAFVPLVRFEGAALSLVIFALLMTTCQWRSAAVQVLLLVVGLGCYMIYMHSLGLPLLPSSVTLKSESASMLSDSGLSLGHLIYVVARNLYRAFRNPNALVLFAILPLFFVGFSFRELFSTAGKGLSRSLLVVVFVLPIVAHLCFGQFGWMERYEVYIVTYGILGVAYLHRDRLVALAEKKAYVLQFALLFAILLALQHYLWVIRTTPAAARGIYDHNYQLHRFVQDFYDAPLAVNDLGYVAYENRNFVLDLWGLGSEEVRRERQAGTFGPEAMQRLVDKYQVDLAILYDVWFEGDIPDNWQAVAELHFEPVTAPTNKATFYKTTSKEMPELFTQLKAFKMGLPNGVYLETEPKSR